MFFEFGKRTYVMGILNVTPDSFSDGGMFMHAEAACERAGVILAEGADIIDIGAESSRPGYQSISAEEEWKRMEPVLLGLDAAVREKVSVDTCKAIVAEKALGAGVGMINDIWGLQGDNRMAAVVGASDAYLVAMHNQDDTDYGQDIIESMKFFFDKTINSARRAGIREEKLILDPGIGFGKNAAQNLEVLRRLNELGTLGFPLLLGASRKRFIGHVLDAAVDDRYEGTLAASVIGIQQGADILRVHDVAGNVKVAKIADAIYRR